MNIDNITTLLLKFFETKMIPSIRTKNIIPTATKSIGNLYKSTTTKSATTSYRIQSVTYQKKYFGLLLLCSRCQHFLRISLKMYCLITAAQIIPIII